MARPIGPDDEIELAASMRRGEPRAFDTLLRTYGPRLLESARHILMRDEDAPEVLGESFAEAFRTRQEYTGDVRLSTWLHRLVLRFALARLPSETAGAEDRMNRLLPRFLPSGQGTEAFAPWPDRETLGLDDRHTGAFVRDAIQQLPRSYRTVLLLRDIEGVTTEEAADILATTPGEVRVRLHRARMALRMLIAPRFGGST